MVRRSVVNAISVGLFAVLSGCAAPQSLETSRSSTAIHVPNTAAVSALSRKFRAETPYIVTFGFDSDRLDAEAIAELDVQADWIIDHPNVKFRVYGHTDRVGNQEYNAALGLRRAEQVVAYLMSRGISEDRLEAMASFGEGFPMVETDAAERMNRRTMTDVIGYLLPVQQDNNPGSRVSVLQQRIEQDMVPIVDTDLGQAQFIEDQSDDGDQTSGAVERDQHPGGQNPNAGRGNGDESGDPGNSGGKNKGGDEVV